MKVDDLGHIFKTTTSPIGMDFVLLQMKWKCELQILSFSGLRMWLLFKEEDYLYFFRCCENGTQLTSLTGSWLFVLVYVFVLGGKMMNLSVSFPSIVEVHTFRRRSDPSCQSSQIHESKRCGIIDEGGYVVLWCLSYLMKCWWCNAGNGCKVWRR